jgi:ubiquinol-cytochrome c reductase cytochrome c subunit
MDASAAEPPRPARRVRRLSSVIVVLVALGVIGAIYAAMAPSGQAAGSGFTAHQVQQGRKIFLTGCSSCHGLNAEGGARAPSLVGIGAAAVDFQMSTGRMPLARHSEEAKRKPPQYNKSQTRAVAAYIASLGAGPAIPKNVDARYPNADAAKGGDIFRTNCAQCHNFIGSHGALTYGKFAPSLTPPTPTQIYEAMLTGPEQMPLFNNTTINPQEKLDIVKFVVTSREEANPGGNGLGRIGPTTEGLVAFLGGIGGLVFISIWIGSRSH